MLPEINLLPKYERQSSVIYVLFIVGSILAILMFILLIYFYIVMKGNIEDTEADVNNLKDEKLLLETKLATLNQTNTGTDGTLETAVSYAEQLLIPTSILIDELRETLPQNGSLTTYTYNYQSVQINTEMPSKSDAASYLGNLLESNYLQNATVHSISPFSSVGEGDEETTSENFSIDSLNYNVNYTLDVYHDYLLEEGEDE